MRKSSKFRSRTHKTPAGIEFVRPVDGLSGSRALNCLMKHGTPVSAALNPPHAHGARFLESGFLASDEIPNAGARAMKRQQMHRNRDQKFDQVDVARDSSKQSRGQLRASTHIRCCRHKSSYASHSNWRFRKLRSVRCPEGAAFTTATVTCQSDAGSAMRLHPP